ncbi:Polycystin-1 [Manis javanica]|nr:Polycystin-1 [Manis javanica]
MTLGDEPAQVVHPLCPLDTEIFPGNEHCYRLVAEKAAWLQAQEQCRAWAGAALAMVDSPAIQHFRVSRVTRSLDVWIGFSAVEVMVAGPVWDAENFLMGAPVGDLQGPLSLLVQLEALSAPQEAVEVMVFAGLGLSREAFLTTAEFGTQALGRPAQLRLQVTFHGQDRPLLPGDLISLQHDAGAGALLHCPPAHSHSGSEVPYFSTSASAWLTRLPAQLEVAPAGPACTLRLLAATEQLTPLLDMRPNPGLRRPGHYEVRVMMGNSVSRQNLSRSFTVLSPVAGLRVFHPIPPDGHFYVSTNGSALVLQVDSGDSATATAHWLGGSVHAPFEATCPTTVAALVPGYAKANATLFSVLALPGLSKGEHTVEVVVENSAGCANLSLPVRAEEPISGLQAPPCPEACVLQGVLVRYSPVVKAGSDVIFHWTINDKQSLTFHNVVFNVIYQRAAVFKLLVGRACGVELGGRRWGSPLLPVPLCSQGPHAAEASNHVSNVTVNYNVTVEHMHRMQGLRMSVVLPVLPLGATLALAADVLMDTAVDVSFLLWDFEDCSPALMQHQPEVNHTFASQGMYHVCLEANNMVFVLEVLWIDPTGCIPEQPHARLTAHVTGNPALYIFDWTFGDGPSNMTIQGDPTGTHNFTRSGTFPLALDLSSHVNEAHYFTSVCVEPEVGNVTLWPERQFVQLGNAAQLAACAWPPSSYRYTWDFDTEAATHTGSSQATVTYRDSGSYLVTVTGSKNVSAANDSALVEVQEPVELTGIEVNSSHVLELQQPYLLSAVGRGHPATYLWELGDGRWLEGPMVNHVYNSIGRFAIRVVAWNEVSLSEARLNVTVQQRVRGLSVNASCTVVPLNGSVNFSTLLEAGSDVR